MCACHETMNAFTFASPLIVFFVLPALVRLRALGFVQDVHHLYFRSVCVCVCGKCCFERKYVWLTCLDIKGTLRVAGTSSDVARSLFVSRVCAKSCFLTGDARCCFSVFCVVQAALKDVKRIKTDKDAWSHVRKQIDSCRDWFFFFHF